MVSTKFVCLLLLAIHQSKGDSIVVDGVKTGFKEILNVMIEGLNETKTEVDNIKKELENERHLQTNVMMYNKETDPCLSLFAKTDPCPNINDVLQSVSKDMVEIAVLIKDAYTIYANTFNDPSFSCGNTLNPFKALKCFLRAFREAYTKLSDLTEEVKTLKEDIHKTIVQWRQYSTHCVNGTTVVVEMQSRLRAVCQQLNN